MKMFQNRPRTFQNDRRPSNTSCRYGNNRPRAPHYFRRPHPYERNDTQSLNVAENSSEFYCETCDRSFKTDNLLQAHISEHQKCGIDGCKFVAHPKVVTKHIQMQHSTGLYDRIKNLETKEDVEKWIEERKKNFPSKKAIEEKKEKEKECTNRGERLRKPNNRFNHRNDKNFKKNKFKSRPKYPINAKTKRIEKINIKTETEEENVYCGLMEFKGISQMLLEDASNESHSTVETIDIEDDEWKEEESISSKKSPIVCKALGALMAAYGSSEDEASTGPTLILTDKIENSKIDSDFDSGPEETSVVRHTSGDVKPANVAEVSSNTTMKNEERKCEEIKAGLDGPNETSGKSTDKAEESSNKTMKNKERKRQENKTDAMRSKDNDGKNKHNNLTTFQRQMRYYKNRRSTLLERLLEKEIRHERNAILQCIKYIVQNDFFDKGRTSDRV